jgi:signal transduction histidine kinase
MLKLSLGRKNLRISKFKAGIVIAALWMAVLSAAGYLVYLGLDSYDKARDRISDQALSYAHLIAEHDRFGFTVADVILRDMLDFLHDEDFNGKMRPERRKEVLSYLTRHRERLPGIASFTVIGANGIRRIGVVGKDFTDLSDRGYFRACRDGREFFVSNIEDGRASGKPGVHIARRYTAPDGSFGGVILINLAAEDVFFSFYKSLDLGKNYATTLRDPERILISYPKFSLSATSLQRKDELSAQVAVQDRGVVRAQDSRDGMEKLTAFERLEGTNFYATVSLPTDQELAEPRMMALGAILAAVLCIFGALGATAAIARNHALATARDEAEKASAERKMLIRKLNTIVEDDRKEIAIEIHDVLNAMLIRVRLDAQGILNLAARAASGQVMDEVSERAQSIHKHANELYKQCRGIVTRLRPEILDVLGLEQAVDEMIRDYNSLRRDCEFTFKSAGDMSFLENSVAITVYRIIQEALSNAVKHSGAQSVDVSLQVDRERSVLQVEVADDGIGFDPARMTVGIGVIGMRERVIALGGALNIRSDQNHGTHLSASIPIFDQTNNANAA